MGRIKHIMQLVREGWSKEEIKEMLGGSDPEEIVQSVKDEDKEDSSD